jgi:hypothetical protein
MFSGIAVLTVGVIFLGTFHWRRCEQNDKATAELAACREELELRLSHLDDCWRICEPVDPDVIDKLNPGLWGVYQCHLCATGVGDSQRCARCDFNADGIIGDEDLRRSVELWDRARAGWRAWVLDQGLNRARELLELIDAKELTGP